MGVIIRREQRQARRGRWLAITLGIGAGCLGLAGLGMAWRAGGPEPIHEISVPVAVPAAAGR